MPAKTATLQTATCSSQQVRTKFFNMMGIDTNLGKTNNTACSSNSSGNNNCSSSPAKTSSGTDQSNWVVHPRIQHVANTEEFLKYNKHEDRVFSPKRLRPGSSETTTENKKKRRKNITFDEQVKVIPIPTKDEYSNRVRERLWSSANELHQNAARNTVEFLSEGWNWRNVTEDDSMYQCNITGERIHPVHYANLGIEPGEKIPHVNEEVSRLLQASD